MNLRPYQIEALNSSVQARSEGIRRQLIVMATGTGKTELFAKFPTYHKLQKRMIVLAHREELVEQAFNKLKKRNPNLSVGVEMAECKASSGDQIVVASVQSIAGRLNRYDPREIGIVTPDEAHHYTAPSFIKVLEGLGLYDDTLDSIFLGVTATPNRPSGDPLAKIFDRIVYAYGIMDGIRDGYLAEPLGFRVSSGVDLDQVRTTAGDFNQADLSEAINTPKNNQLVVRSWLDYAQQRQTVGFTVDIQHAKDLALMFNKHGIPAEAVWGADPQRQEKLARHKAKETMALFNAQLLTEGYDDWQLGCIINAAPTQSELTYMQRMGRGTRIEDDVCIKYDNLHHAREQGYKPLKENCIVLDMVGSSTKHSLVTLPSLFGMNPDLDLKGKSAFKAVKKLEELQEKHQNVDFSKLQDITKIKAFVESVNLFDFKVPPVISDNSKLRWLQNFDGSLTLILPYYKSEDVEVEGQEKKKAPQQRLTIRKNALGKYDLYGAVKDQIINDQNMGDDLAGVILYADLLLSSQGRQYTNMMLRETKNGGKPASAAQWGLIQKLYKYNPKEMAELERMRITGELTNDKAKHIINTKMNSFRKVNA